MDDSPDDAQLIINALRAESLSVAWERVDTLQDFEAALEQAAFDIVIADYRLPQFTALDVLRVLRSRECDVPVIVASGSMVEDDAIEAMRSGARDFVLKDRLARLGPAVRREIGEAAVRRGRRSADADLRLEQQRFRALVEGAAEAISVVDRDGTIIYASPSTDRVLGHALDDVVGRSALAFVHPDDVPATQQALETVLQRAGAVVHLVVRCPGRDGTDAWMEVTGKNLLDDPAVRGVVVNYRDVTERRRSAEAVRESEELYRATFDEAPVGITHAALDGRFLRVNQEFSRLLGYTAAELLQRDVAAVTLPDELALDQATHADLVAGRIRRHMREKRYVRKDGSLVWTLRTVALRRDSAGRPLHFIGIVEDISQRKHAEFTVRLLQERFQAILDHSPALIYLKDLEGRFTLVNRLFAQNFVPPGATAIGRTPEDLFSHATAAAKRAHDAEVLARGEAVTREETIDLPGGPRVYMCSKFPLRDAAGVIHSIGCVATDITERKDFERRFLQAQKMEAFGQLAGGVAHDFNNILAVMLMHFNLMSLDAELPAKTQSGVRELEQLASRASNLVRQLLIFSRRHELSKQANDFNTAIDGTCKMLKRFLGENIAFAFEPAPRPLWGEADPGMVEQVVLNLCVNARDAMPQGGELTVSLHACRHTNPDTPGARPADYVCLAVRDTGHGMDEQTQRRVFEPFFTTKPVGHGTGLGLATVHGVAKQHGGWVELESAPHAGSTFRVFFPAAGAAGEHAIEARPRLPRGNGRVLLVEDEEPVRTVAAACLKLGGYEVVEAADGIEALRRWEESGDFDVLLSDVVMPNGLSGLDLASRLQAEKPGLKVIVMSGYNPTGADANAPASADIVRLAKPFSAVRLLEVVRDACAAPASGRASPPAAGQHSGGRN